MATGQLGDHNLVENGRVDRRGEEHLGKLDLADLLAGSRVKGRRRHD